MGNDTIIVTGEAERHEAPDVAEWEVTVQATDPDARAAYERCAARSAAAVERLKGIAQVETRNVAVRPHWEGDEDGGFEHMAEMEVVARTSVAHAAELTEVAAGAEELHGPDLSLADRGPIELDAL